LLQHFSGDIAANPICIRKTILPQYSRNTFVAILPQHFSGDVAATLFWQYCRKSNLHTKNDNCQNVAAILLQYCQKILPEGQYSGKGIH
jgi:hypothetical protein